jgi:Rrf2 family iron-sulfur cluster assembly transcriptional regulator
MCEGGRDCQDGEECLTHQLWTKLGREIFDFLNGITLASFIERDEVNEVIQRQQARITVTVPSLDKTLA